MNGKKEKETEFASMRYMRRFLGEETKCDKVQIVDLMGKTSELIRNM
jgi:hypothetical protein